MNRTYEIMFIVRPDVEEADLDKLIEGFSANVTNGGGEVKSVEKMGRRRLAYTVRKFNDGFYVLLNVAAAGSLIAEIERRLRVSEQVIKFITVRMDEEEKRLAKVKAIRDTKVKRSAQPIAPAAQAPRRCRCRGSRCSRSRASSRLLQLPTRCRDRCRSGLVFALKHLRCRLIAASHNASRSPHTASTRPMLVECSETPTRVWSGRRHNVPERKQQWLTKRTARNPTEQHAPASTPSGALRPLRSWRRPPPPTSCRRSRRRPWRPQVLPPQEGLQVLHREDRRHLATATFACCRASSPSAARSFRAA